MGNSSYLLKEDVQRAEPGEKRYEIADSKGNGIGAPNPKAGRFFQPGFVVDVFPSGAKIFRVRGRLHGKVRVWTIGPYGEWSVEQARKRAAEIRRAADRGRDLVAEVEQAAEEARREARRDETTIADLAERFFEEHAYPRDPDKPHGGGLAASTVRLYRLAFDNYLIPALGELPLAELTRSVFEHRVYRPTIQDGNGPMANRVQAALQSAWNWADGLEKDRLFESDAQNPAALPRGKKYSERKGKKRGRSGRALTSEELTAIGPGLADSKVVTSATLFYLLTGCRPVDVRRMKWKDVQPDGRRVSIPVSKTGSRTLYLGKDAAAIIEQRRKLWPETYRRSSPASAPKGDDYVFASDHPRNFLGELSESAIRDRFKKAAGDLDARVYDAGRHTFRSRAIYRHGIAREFVDELTGHAPDLSTASHYYEHPPIEMLLDHAETVSRGIYLDLFPREARRLRVAK